MSFFFLIKSIAFTRSTFWTAFTKIFVKLESFEELKQNPERVWAKKMNWERERKWRSVWEEEECEKGDEW